VSHALYLGSSPEVHMYFLHGVTAGVCRPHQRLMYLEALSVVARESEGGYREGGQHAGMLYRLICAAQAENYLTKTESDQFVEIREGLLGLATLWANDFRQPVFAMREHSNGSARGGEASCENDETAYGRNG
jgi:hypothetical protein